MRAIKFRAWDTENKKMVSDISLGTVNFYESLNEFFKSTNLMQFTGLLDKNGTEIYEGDVVAYGTDKPQEIIYEKGMFTWRNEGSMSLGNYYSKLMEVVGNIYENPELLKQ